MTSLRAEGLWLGGTSSSGSELRKGISASTYGSPLESSIPLGLILPDDIDRPEPSFFLVTYGRSGSHSSDKLGCGSYTDPASAAMHQGDNKGLDRPN